MLLNHNMYLTRLQLFQTEINLVDWILENTTILIPAPKVDFKMMELGLWLLLKNNIWIGNPGKICIWIWHRLKLKRWFNPDPAPTSDPKIWIRRINSDYGDRWSTDHMIHVLLLQWCSRLAILLCIDMSVTTVFYYLMWCKNSNLAVSTKILFFESHSCE